MKSKQILSLMNIVSWIVFIGLCIQAGTIIYSVIVSLWINPEAAQNFFSGPDLSSVYETDVLYFVNVASFIVALSVMKAYLFFLVVRIFLKVDFDMPFSKVAVSLVTKISHVALGLGIVSIIAQSYSRWLNHRGVEIQQNWGSSDYLFLAGVIFVIALVFRRGMEIQDENELTI